MATQKLKSIPHEEFDKRLAENNERLRQELAEAQERLRQLEAVTARKEVLLNEFDAGHITVEQLFASLPQQHISTSPHSQSSLGLFADEPEMMDQVIEMVRSERENPIVERVNDIE